MVLFRVDARATGGLLSASAARREEMAIAADAASGTTPDIDSAAITSDASTPISNTVGVEGLSPSSTSRAAGRTDFDIED
jgi:hypothetical protein